MANLITLSTKRSQKQFEILPGETILFAGLRAGLDLPHECCSGTCGTCQAQALDEASILSMWDEAPGKSFLPEGAGRVLMCQTAVSRSAEFKLFGSLRDRDEHINSPDYFSATLQRQRRLNDDVMAFDLKLEEACTYIAGQFGLLSIPEVEGWRAYSMTSQPSHNGATQLTFVIRKKTGGFFSEWLFSGDRTGHEIRFFGPVGKAVLKPESDGDIVIIAGGSGIAGMMAILEDAIETPHLSSRQARVFFGVRNPDAMFFNDELSDMVDKADGKLSVTIAYSESPPSEPLPQGNLYISSGNIHEVARRDLVSRPAPSNAVYFLAGPSQMVEAAQSMLREDADVADNQIRYDKFS